MFRHIHHRLIAIISLMFVIVQSVTLIAIYTATEHNLISTIETRLEQAKTAFKNQFNQRVTQYAASARILAKDFGFREAVATRDIKTILSALVTVQDKLIIDRVMLIALDDTVFVDTQHAKPYHFPFPNLICEAREDAIAYAIGILDERVYEIVIVPIQAPDVIAYIGIAKEVNTQVMNEFKTNAYESIELSILRQQASGHWTLSASTLNNQALKPSTALIQSMLDQEKTVTLSGHNKDYVTTLMPLRTASHSAHALVMLQINLTAAIAVYYPLITWLIGLFVLALFIGISVSFLIGRSLAKPIAHLVDAASRIQQGDYSTRIVSERNDELGKLADTMNAMIDAIAQREQTVLFQMRHDHTTQLANKAYFLTLIQQAIERAREQQTSLALVNMGIPRFNDIAFTLGHHLADHFIQQIAQRLKTHLPNWPIARSNHDTLSILMLDVAPTMIQTELAALIDILNFAFDADGIKIEFRPRIGYALFPEHDNHAEKLMQHADVALYLASRHPQNDIMCYDKQRDPYNEFNLTLMQDLRQSIEANELALFFQPKIDIHTNTIVEAETLLRWYHPRHGLILPNDFIPMAERTGNMPMVSFYVLERVIQQLKQWEQQDIPIRLAVNLSAKDLGNEQLHNFLLEKTTEYNVSPTMMTLEITESAIMENPEFSLNLLQALKRSGFKLSIDDYGTGYSSMQYLKQLPVSELKIDKSFVLDLATNEEDKILVRSTIALAHSFGLAVVAEGIEDAAALALLSSYGCDLGQGYYFSKALSADDLYTWLNNAPWGIKPS